ncbi:MAG TPA: MlaD family protein [Solirubrobacteraceae bacterium]|nr:MlaD family protein [Solirubrobacteraceae bacterium]
MRLRGGSAPNPVLTGAATVLIVLLAVFLAYNANSGLPGVPAYRITVEVPDAARLTAGNEVRIRGRRAGQVSEIEPRVDADGKAYARLKVRLEQSVGELPVDTTARVRPRSMLGLKYLELTPGESERTLPNASTLPLRQARERVELDQVLQAFDAETRRDLTSGVTELSSGVAGRGADLNAAIGELAPLTKSLEPVMRTLADPRTDLEGAIDGIEGATAAIAPVSEELAGLLQGLAVTLDALVAAEPGLEQTLVELPVTAASATRSLHTISPVLADAAALMRDVRPAARLLPRAATGLADLARRGTPVLERATDLGPDLEDTLRAVGRLVAEPSTLASVEGLTEVVASLGPTLRAVNPFQVDCNYLGLWTRNASSTISEGDTHGTWFRFIPIYQPTEIAQSAEPAPELHATPYGRVDGECETGNEPFLPGQRIGNPEGRQAATTEDTGG